MNTQDKSIEHQSGELLQKRTRELQALVRVAQLINTIDLDYVLSQTLHITTEISGASKGSLFLLNSQRQPIQRFITQRDLPPEMTRQVAQDVVEKGLAGWCVRHKEGAVVPDIEKDERWFIFSDDEQQDVRSALCMPVMHKDEVSGIITLVHPSEGHFSEANLELVGAIANQASTAIRNAQLFDTVEMKQKQLELMLQNNSEALITVNREFTIQLFNPAARKLFPNRTTDELIGTKLDEVDSDSIYPEVVRRIQKTTEGTSVISFQLRDDLQKRDFAVYVSTLKSDRDTTMQGYVIMLHDIT
ncbi:MAG TPA: GAF domain-containing protein, partial [Aggregatilineales bacterium]|nr:GAF domain-containing protein [Aggregatilineales bacterium]